MRLILHAGTHKTGTTSTQHFAHRNRTELRDRGLYYAEGGTGKVWRSHNWMAHWLTAAYSDGTDPVRASLDRARAEAGNGSAVLISSEDLSVCCDGHRLWHGLDRTDFRGLQRSYLEKLGSLLRDFDVEIILVFRRADEYAQSLYQTLIAGNHYHGDFETYLHNFAPLFDYSSQREAFRAVFPNVRCVSYHNLGSNIVGGFFKMLDLPLPAEPGPRKNVSTDARLTYWLATRNAKRQLESETFALEKKFTKSDAALKLFPDFGAASFWPSVDARRSFHDKTAERFEPDFFPDLRPKSEPFARLQDSEFDRVTRQFESWKAMRAMASRPAPLGIKRWLGARFGRSL